MRTILYTGKGGVGKTSTAAATALRCAQLGHRTVVLSTDVAHSLADSFDVKLGAEPTLVVPNLWAQEVDVYHEIHRHWGTVRDYIYKMLTWRGLNEAVAEEMTLLPGMDELSSLLLIAHYAETGAYDVCVVDCAPTGETLRLLSFPEGIRWWIRSVIPFQRKISQLLGPFAKKLTDMPLPDDLVYESLNQVLDKLTEMQRILSDPEQSTIRLVLTPEKMVIKEAQRTYTYLNLYGFAVDAVVCNRIIPESAAEGYFARWKEIQAKHLQLIDECFAPLPILKAPLFDEEVLGLDVLQRMSASLFGEEDPSRAFFHGKTHDLRKEGDGYLLTLPLPLAAKGDLEMMRHGEELVLRVGFHRRNILLPRAVAGLETRGAKFEDGELRITFA